MMGKLKSWFDNQEKFFLEQVTSAIGIPMPLCNLAVAYTHCPYQPIFTLIHFRNLIMQEIGIEKFNNMDIPSELSGKLAGFLNGSIEFDKMYVEKGETVRESLENMSEQTWRFWQQPERGHRSTERWRNFRKALRSIQPSLFEHAVAFFVYRDTLPDDISPLVRQRIERMIRINTPYELFYGSANINDKNYFLEIGRAS